MKFASLLLSLAALPAALFAASGTAIPGGNQSGTFVISKPGAYYLAADRVMMDGTKTAIEIAAPDVTLDLNGFALRYGVNVDGNADAISCANAANLEIRNGTIAYFPRTGLSIAAGTNVRLIDLRIHDCTSGSGIHCGAGNVLVQRCLVQEVNQWGINCWSGKATVIRDCSVMNCQGGIHAGAYAEIRDNTIESISQDGILVGGNGLVEHNMIKDANGYLQASSGGIVANGSLTVIRGNQVAAHNGIITTEGVCLLEKNTVFCWTSGAIGFLNQGLGANRSTLADNRYYVVNGTVSVGLWVDAGGNLSL